MRRMVLLNLLLFKVFLSVSLSRVIPVIQERLLLCPNFKGLSDFEATSLVARTIGSHLRLLLTHLLRKFFLRTVRISLDTIICVSDDLYSIGSFTPPDSEMTASHQLEMINE